MYLITNGEFPYCGYHHTIELNINPNSPKTKGATKNKFLVLDSFYLCD